MDEKDKIIASLKKQLQEALSKVSALEQEVALLNYQIMNYTKHSMSESIVPTCVPIK